jgi:hypothetical protein
MLGQLHTATLDLCFALHAWVGFERAHGQWGDMECGVQLGREATFGQTLYAWPAPRVARIQFLEPGFLVASERLSAHERLQRSALHLGCVAAWKAWEHRLACDVPALWPAIAMPRFTLLFDSTAYAFSSARVHFLGRKTNLGKKHEEDNTMPFSLFADRLVARLQPLVGLPRATGVWAMGGPEYTGEAHNSFSLKGPVMAGAGPAEAAVVATALNPPSNGLNIANTMERHLQNGFAALPSLGARHRAETKAIAFLQSTSAGV